MLEGLRHASLNIENEYEDVLSIINNNFRNQAVNDENECYELAKLIGQTTRQWRRRVALTTEIFSESIRRLSIAERDAQDIREKIKSCDRELDAFWKDNAEMQAKITSIERLLRQEQDYMSSNANSISKATYK